MNLYLSLAWRNLWRNRRRSLISASSIVFAVLIALATRSMQLGFYSHTIHNMVSFHTGYLQVHASGFEADPGLELSFDRPDSLARLVERVRHVTVAAPRLESFALLSGRTITDGAQLEGIDPVREDRLTGLRSRLSAGGYLGANDDRILLGSELARHLGVRVGDTLVALGSGYHAMSAAARFVVAGLVTFPIPQLNAHMAYVALPAAQAFLDAPDRVTSLAVMLDDPRALAAVSAAVGERLSRAYEVIRWEQILPEVVQYIRLDNASGLLMLLLVYVVIAFGILGTVLMMTLERTREFGVLVALGMPRSALAGVVMLESLILALVGSLSGILLGLPLLLGLAAHPIVLGGAGADALRHYGFEPVLPFSLQPSIFLWQPSVTLAIALAASVMPLMRIRAIEPVRAMRRGI